MHAHKYLRKEIDIAGRKFSIEFGRMAGQASGAVLARYGDTVVLVTATRQALREDLDFLPLTVDYEERHYAVGRIPGSFLKREGRPGEKAVLSARLIDRCIRPLFPKNFKQDVHVVALVLSVDQDCSPTTTAILGVSAALTISDIPFDGPIASCVVGYVDGEFVLNPTLEEDAKSHLNLVVSGSKDAINMVEAGALEMDEKSMVEALALAQKEIARLAGWLEEVKEEAKTQGLVKEKIALPDTPDAEKQLAEEVRKTAYEPIKNAVLYCQENQLDKLSADQHINGVKENLKEEIQSSFPEEEGLGKMLNQLEREAVRSAVLEKGLRLDGRRPETIRPLEIGVDFLPRTHGSGLFRRGQTQVLSVLTLGAVRDEQILDGLDPQETKRFLHHYNFPGYSTGEARPMRTSTRREIGHGALAGRALEAVLPDEDEFPYTIRIVSEVLESNGSSSMASVCAGCLALMDAGVPIKAPVAGIAMGLMKEDDKVVILTDILGDEDHLGDMDFKVAGTAAGITALQMDIKTTGITSEILEEAMSRGREARLYILESYQEVIKEPRPELSPRAPRVYHIKVDPEKIRDIIGPGGKTIRKITEATDVGIDVEDDGQVYITAPNPDDGQKALEIIKSLTAEVEVGKIYLGKVVKVTDFGAFVEVIPGVIGLPGKEGLVHISQLAHERVNRVEDVCREGDQILVKAIGFDNHGRLKLSKKEALDANGQNNDKQPFNPNNARTPHGRGPQGQ